MLCHVSTWLSTDFIVSIKTGERSIYKCDTITMPLSRKSIRELEETASSTAFEFDFGDPEVVSVEIAEGKYFTLREPSAENLIEIDMVGEDKSLNDIEATLKTICILHVPEKEGRKLTLKDAKKLRGRQIRKLGDAIGQLLGLEEDTKKENGGDEEDMKS